MEELFKNGCQSDLEISDEEREPTISVPRLLDEDIPVHDQPGDFQSDRDSDSNIPLTELQTTNQENIPPPLVNPCTSESTSCHTTQKKMLKDMESC